MKKHLFPCSRSLAIALLFLFICGKTGFAQIVSGNLFLQGAYLEAGFQNTGAMGTSVNAPTGYHPHGGTPPCGGSSPLASVYDWGHDGWSTGTPAYMGDYTLPGSPWEYWGIQVGGTVMSANAITCGYTGSITGGFTSYTNTGGRATGIWTGTAASGALAITQVDYVDTMGSAVMIKVTFRNTTSSPLTDITYLRACDPDNNETWPGGSFSTDNRVIYQNDAAHRVMVSATSVGGDTATGIPATSISLGTKDERAKAVVFTGWPLASGCTLSSLWADSSTCYGSAYYDTTTTHSGDIAIGLVINLGTIPAYDSTSVTFAYIYNGVFGLDSAFVTTPGLSVDSFAVVTPDTVTPCGYPGVSHLTVNITNSASTTSWSWAPSTALSGTTGTSQTINRSAITAVTTYTLTGTDTSSGHTVVYTLLLTVDPLVSMAAISGASTVCAGSSITLTDATSSGSWSSSNTSIATVNSSTGVVTGIANGSDTIRYTLYCGTVSVYKVITVTGPPTGSAISGPSTVCIGGTITLADSISGGSWSSSNLAVASVSYYGIVRGISAGTTTISYATTNSCGTTVVTKTVTVSAGPGAPSAISGSTSLCLGGTETLTDTTTGGTWSSGSPSIASVSSGGVVTATGLGSAIISYTVSNSCGSASSSLTVNVTTIPSPPAISGPTTVCMGSSITLTDGTSGGTWASSNSVIASVNASTGVTNGINSGTVTITYTVSNTCGTAAVETTITVGGPPSAPATITGTATVCVGATTTLSDATTGGSWSSGSPAVASVSSSGVVTGVSAGTASISYTVTNTCGSMFTSRTVTVNGGPSVSAISGVTSVCTGSSITLTDATSGGVWSTASAGIASVSSGGVVTGISTGTAVISYTVTGTCGSNTATKSVSIITIPSVAAISGASSLCNGTSTTLTDAASGGTWSSVSPSIATVNSSGLVTGLSSGSTTISYTLTNTCGSAAATKSVAVTALPSAGTISGPGTVCTGSTITLSDGTAGGTWTSSNSSIASISSSGVVTGISSGTAVISYSVTSSCGSALATTTVTVNPSPNAGSITGVASLCVASTASMTESAGSGTWSSSAPSIASINSAGVVTGIAAGSVTVSYTVTNSCGTAFATHSLIINALPNAGTITGPSTVCMGSSVTLSESASGGTWSSSAPAVASVTTAGVVTGISAGSVTISYSVTTTCGTATSGYVMNVSSLPSAGSIAGASVVCTGASITLTDAVSGGTWSSSGPSMATVTSGGIVMGVSAGAVTISYTVSTSCATVSTTKSISVSTAASAGTISGLSSVCTGLSITLTTSGTAGGSWSSSNNGLATVSGGVVHGISAGMVTISYSLTTSCGTVVSTKSVTVTATPTVTAISGASNVCIGTSTTYTDATSGGGWISSNTTIATINSGGVLTAISAGAATITYFVTNTCGTATTTKAITVNSLSAGVISGASTIAVGASTTLTNTVAGGTWSSVHTTIATVNTTGSVTGVSAGSDTIKYAVTNVCGTATASKLMTVTAHRDAMPISSNTNEPTEIDVNVYPNPNSGIFTLELKGTSGVAHVIISDIVGRKMVETTSEEQLINFDMSKYATGTYLMQVSVDGNVFTKKILIR